MRLSTLLPLACCLLALPACGGDAPADPACTDECSESAARCADNASQLCTRSAAGCWSWGTPTACPSGQCLDGLCGGQQPILSIAALEYPALVSDAALGLQDKFPTPLAHLVGSASLESPVPMVRVTVANAAMVNATGVTVETDLVGYGTAASQSLDLAAGASATVTLTPALDLPKLLALSTEVPASLVTTVRWGGEVAAQQTRAIGVLGRGSFYLKNLRYLPVFVTPNDRAGAIRTLLSAAANRMEGRAMVGYQPLEADTLTVTIGVGNCHWERVFLVAGNPLAGKLTSVSGGLDADVDLFILDSANHALCDGGQPCSSLLAKGDQQTGAAFSFTAPKTEDFYLWYCNSKDNFVSRSVTRRRTASHQEIARYQAHAIFNSLKDLGIKYVNTPGGTTWWSAIQDIKYPVETLAQRAGNCIDGTAVFASVFEALGMRPYLLLPPGHAFVGVQIWPGEEYLVAVETTMVGTGTFEEALEAGMRAFSQGQAAGNLRRIDVGGARQQGILPAPM